LEALKISKKFFAGILIKNDGQAGKHFQIFKGRKIKIRLNGKKDKKRCGTQFSEVPPFRVLISS